MCLHCNWIYRELLNLAERAYRKEKEEMSVCRMYECALCRCERENADGEEDGAPHAGNEPEMKDGEQVAAEVIAS